MQPASLTHRGEQPARFDDRDFSTVPDFLLAPRERSRSRSRSRGSTKQSRVRRPAKFEEQSDLSLSNSAILEKDGHYYYDQRNNRRLRDVDRMSVRSGTNKKQMQDRHNNLEKWSKSYVQKSKNGQPQLRTSGTVKKIQEVEDAGILPTEFKLRRKQESQPTLDGRRRDHSGDSEAVRRKPQTQGELGDWGQPRDPPALDFKKKAAPRVEPMRQSQGEAAELKEIFLNITEHSRSSAEDESETQNRVPKRAIFQETMDKDDHCPSDKETATAKINNASGGPSYNELSHLVEALREENSRLKASQEDRAKEAARERLAHERVKHELAELRTRAQSLSGTVAELETEAGKADRLEKQLARLEMQLEQEKGESNQRRAPRRGCGTGHWRTWSSHGRSGFRSWRGS